MVWPLACLLTAASSESTSTGCGKDQKSDEEMSGPAARIGTCVSLFDRIAIAGLPPVRHRRQLAHANLQAVAQCHTANHRLCAFVVRTVKTRLLLVIVPVQLLSMILGSSVR